MQADNNTQTENSTCKGKNIEQYNINWT